MIDVEPAGPKENDDGTTQADDSQKPPPAVAAREVPHHGLRCQTPLPGKRQHMDASRIQRVLATNETGAVLCAATG
jgi:hypothetical protein